MIKRSQYLSCQTYLTTAQLKEEFKKADSIDLANRDTSGLMSVIQKDIATSPRIKGLIQTRLTGVDSFEYNLNSIDKKTDTSEIKAKTQKFVKKAMKAAVEMGLWSDLLAEVVQVPDGIELKIYERNTYEPYTADSFFLYNDDGTKTLIKLSENPNKYIYLVDSLIYRGGTLRSVIDLDIRRVDTIMEWTEFNNRAKGQVVGSYDLKAISEASAVSGVPFSIDSITKGFKEILENIGSNNYAIMPSTNVVKLENMIEAAASNSYSTFISMIDADISIAIVGQANTSQLPAGGGSRAALQVLNLIRNDIIYTDMICAKAIIDELLLIYYRVTENRNATSAPYSFEWKFDDNIDTESFAVSVGNIANVMKVLVNTDEFYAKLGLTRPEGLPDTMYIGKEDAVISTTPTVSSEPIDNNLQL